MPGFTPHAGVAGPSCDESVPAGVPAGGRSIPVRSLRGGTRRSAGRRHGARQDRAGGMRRGQFDRLTSSTKREKNICFELQGIVGEDVRTK